MRSTFCAGVCSPSQPGADSPTGDAAFSRSRGTGTFSTADSLPSCPPPRFSSVSSLSSKAQKRTKRNTLAVRLSGPKSNPVYLWSELNAAQDSQLPNRMEGGCGHTHGQLRSRRMQPRNRSGPRNGDSSPGDHSALVLLAPQVELWAFILIARC